MFLVQFESLFTVIVCRIRYVPFHMLNRKLIGQISRRILVCFSGSPVLFCSKATVFYGVFYF